MKVDFLIGGLLGSIIGMLCIAAIFEPKLTYYHDHQQILEQCEKDLPRNQSCVIIAVPKAN